VKPTFFATPDAFRAWLAAHHDTADELIVGFHKVASGRASITWPQAVDEALCFGWIDSVRRSLDETSYTNRFTPRRKGSNWSAINIKRVGELLEAGLMHPSGIAAFEAREAAKSAIYSYERPVAALDDGAEAAFRANTAAWDWFSARPPSYRRAAIYWVVSAKRADTRARRLATLIEDSAAGRTVGPLTRPAAV
jgi:uncharacterized protein YdeI (YjbR/CyaY-like superfamily)